MKTLATSTNIVETLVIFLKEQEEIQAHLSNGDLYAFERALSGQVAEVLTEATSQLLNAWVTDHSTWLIDTYKAEGFSRCEMRNVEIQIQTGEKISVCGPYARQVEKEGTGTRHLVNRHFSILGNASPQYYSKVAMSSMLCPSYNVGNELLKEFGMGQSETRVRNVTNNLATYCFDKETDLALEEGESLKDKRVVLSIDGGRCNTRENRADRNQKGNLTYETAWCEPKLFVIQVLDKNGDLAKDGLPLYSGRFSDKDMWGLLKEYLMALQIKDAKEIQVLADGAPWIWNNIMPLLLELGVVPEKVTLTLDYYHAGGYVHKLVDAMPGHISKKRKETHLKNFKSWLWNGQCAKIVSTCRQIFKRPSDEVKRWLNYFEKHQDKTQYVDYEANKLMCGSGIIESGIRRVINLRFKNAGTFWTKEAVEKLFFLRAIFLSKRWNILFNNITKLEF